MTAAQVQSSLESPEVIPSSLGQHLSVVAQTEHALIGSEVLAIVERTGKENSAGEESDLPKPTLTPAQTELVESHLNLARGFAYNFFEGRGRSLPRDELTGIAFLGLVKAAIRFEPEKGEFSAYASRTMEGEMLRAYRDTALPIRRKRHDTPTANRVNGAIIELEYEGNLNPTDEAVASRCKLDKDIVKNQRVGESVRVISYDATVTTGDYTNPSIAEFDRGYESVEQKEVLDQCIKNLSDPRYEEIIRRKWGLEPYDRDYTQTEIGEFMGISQMHVSRLHSRALQEIKLLMSQDQDI